MLPIAQNITKLKSAEVATRCHVKRIYFLKFFFAFLSVHIGTKMCSRGKSDYYVFIKYSFHDDNMMIKKNMSMQIWIKIWWCWQQRCIIVEQCTTWTRVAQAAAYYNGGVRWMESCCWPDQWSHQQRRGFAKDCLSSGQEQARVHISTVHSDFCIVDTVLLLKLSMT